MRYLSTICLSSLVITIIMGCDSMLSKKRVVDADDVLLAQVDDREMYLSDISDMLIASNERDSINQLNSYIESWLKRNVVLNEAEVKFPKSIDIDQLVDDYRSSLLLHNYRQELINKDLDTIVTDAQLQSYYNDNKDQYRVSQSLIRAKMAQVPAKSPRIESFYKNWKKKDSIKVEAYLTEYATTEIRDNNRWYPVEEFLSLLPEGLYEARDLRKPVDLQKHHDTSEYFIKVLEVTEPNSIAPLGYVKESIEKIIIHKRKSRLLDNIEQKLYEKYLQSNRIKVYDQ